MQLGGKDESLFQNKKNLFCGQVQEYGTICTFIHSISKQFIITFSVPCARHVTADKITTQVASSTELPSASKSPKGLVSVTISGFCVPRECDTVSPSYLGLVLTRILLFKNTPDDSNADQDDMKTRLS